MWDTLQGMCTYLRSILATRALLEGVGVGNGAVAANQPTTNNARAQASCVDALCPDAATPIAATIQWVLRDGASMMGSLVFAWWGGQLFDQDVKRWRLFADIANDAGLTLDMLSPLAGSWFLTVSCTARICMALCGVAAGSTRAALTAHFARTDNLAGTHTQLLPSPSLSLPFPSSQSLRLQTLCCSPLYAWLC